MDSIPATLTSYFENGSISVPCKINLDTGLVSDVESGRDHDKLVSAVKTDVSVDISFITLRFSFERCDNRVLSADDRKYLQDAVSFAQKQVAIPCIRRARY